MKKKEVFPQYDKLNFVEKFILNTCCYFPPKKKELEEKKLT